jgi:hypothetical protein
VIKWTPELVSDIARRRSVVFLGSGISRNSINAAGKSPKTWREFLLDAAKQAGSPRHVARLLKDGDLLTACEVIKQGLGRDKFNTLLIEEFLSPKYQPATVHETIFKLDSRIVATPNFDKIYETYANHKASGSIRVKHHYDDDVAEAVRRNDRLILKVHGSVDTPNQMIFTRAEYAEARNRHRTFYTVLEALALTHTFVFLGCGVSDPDIRLLLEDIFFRFKHARPHVFVLPLKAVHPDVVKIIEGTMNVNIVTYNPKGKHAELGASLDELVTLVEAERIALQKSMNW